MLADTLVSCGVVFSGGIILFTQWNWVDPVVGVLIAGLILRSSWGVLKESAVLTLDGVPHNIDPEHLQQALLQLENVRDVHHIHIRAVSTTENELTAHVKLQDISLLDKTRDNLKKCLLHHNIFHSVLEFESADYPCQSHC